MLISRAKSTFSRTAVASILMLLAGIALADDTTSEIKGNVTDSGGAAIEGATVVIRHEPTGREVERHTNSAGVFSARGLRIGGPYTVVVQADGRQGERVDQIYLKLSQPADLNFSLSSGAAIEEVVVTAEAGMLHDETFGPSSDFDSTTIATMPSIGRDPRDIVRMDPRAVQTFNGSISIAGNNNRYNSLTVDGIRLNDDFGLNRSGFPGQSTPITVDAIEQLSVNVAPFDVEANNFLGGNINIVTKSGTNEWHGSAYYFYSDSDLAGELPNGQDVSEFERETTGFTLGGPIIKDRLFFFVNYDNVDSVSPWSTGPLGSGSVIEIGNVTQAEVDQVIDIMNNVYGYDPGGIPTSVPTEDENILVKLDAYFNDAHRATFTYAEGEGYTSGITNNAHTNIVSGIFGSGINLASNWNSRLQTSEAWSAQIFSDWSDRFSTELRYSIKKATDDRDNSGRGYAQFGIATAAGGIISVGGNIFFQRNEQSNEYEQFRLKGEYLLGDHTLKFGYERGAFDIRNDFVYGSSGLYEFDSIASLQAQTAYAFGYRDGPGGADAAADWGYAVDSLFLSDSWDITSDLTLMYGLRYESYSSSDRPPLNAAFEARNGISNTANLDGLDLVSPRVGFSWDLNDRTTIRGGVGLFSGGTPNVFYSNGYNNNGVTIAQFDPNNPPGSLVDPNVYLTNVDGSTVPPEVTNALVPGVGAVDAISPDYEIPSQWKYSLGVEYALDMSKIGLGDDWNIAADLIVSDVKEGQNITYLGLNQVGTAADGRPIYDPNTANHDLVLVNTNQGGSTSFTLSLQKSFDSGFEFYAAYMNSDSEDVNSMPTFLHNDNWRQVVAPDPNNLRPETSGFNIDERFVITMSYRKAFFGDNETAIGLFAERRSGLPYSYTYTSGRLFGDPFGSPRSPVYIPTGPGDPIVSELGDIDGNGTANEQGDWDALMSGLRGLKPGIQSRNAHSAPTVSTLDLRVTQEIPVLGDSKITVFMDIQNLANLLNDDWGVPKTYVSDFAEVQVPLIDAELLGDGTYRYNAVLDPKATPLVDASYWSIQLGFNYRF